jgi:hypothetical protein
MSQLWGAIPLAEWSNVPYVSGRIATEQDVEQGRAVFYFDGKSTPVDMELPCRGVQKLVDGIEQLVVVIQAELTESGMLYGVRPIEGGNGICLAHEVRLLDKGFAT